MEAFQAIKRRIYGTNKEEYPKVDPKYRRKKTKSRAAGSWSDDDANSGENEALTGPFDFRNAANKEAKSTKKKRRPFSFEDIGRREQWRENRGNPNYKNRNLAGHRNEEKYKHKG